MQAVECLTVHSQGYDRPPKGRGSTMGVQLRKTAWLALPLDDRRDFIRSKFHVVLHPHTVGSAPNFDPDTVGVHTKKPGESRHMLDGNDISRLERVSFGGGLSAMAPAIPRQPVRFHLRPIPQASVPPSTDPASIGSTFDRSRKQRERFAKLAERDPTLARIARDIESRRNPDRDAAVRTARSAP
jgi:hypothetical protein